MNEILKQLLERGYQVNLSLKDHEYQVRNCDMWQFNHYMLTYEDILATIRKSYTGANQPSQTIMSPSMYESVKELLNKK